MPFLHVSGIIAHATCTKCISQTNPQCLQALVRVEHPRLLVHAPHEVLPAGGDHGELAPHPGRVQHHVVVVVAAAAVVVVLEAAEDAVDVRLAAVAEDKEAAVSGCDN